MHDDPTQGVRRGVEAAGINGSSSDELISITSEVCDGPGGPVNGYVKALAGQFGETGAPPGNRGKTPDEGRSWGWPDTVGRLVAPPQGGDPDAAGRTGRDRPVRVRGVTMDERAPLHALPAEQVAAALELRESKVALRPPEDICRSGVRSLRADVDAYQCSSLSRAKLYTNICLMTKCIAAEFDGVM